MEGRASPGTRGPAVRPVGYQAWSETLVEDPKWGTSSRCCFTSSTRTAFEPIVNSDHKRWIVERFKALAGSEANIDKQVLAIRTALTPTEGERLQLVRRAPCESVVEEQAEMGRTMCVGRGVPCATRV